MKNLKVALVHDYIKEYGGAERVLETLHEIFPEAPVYTSVYLPKFLGPHKERFKDWKIRTSILQYLPFKQKLISPLRLVAPWVFRQFDLSEFDVVIVSATGAYEPNWIWTKKRPHPDPLLKGEGVNNHINRNGIDGAVQICYCHTPPRYLYGYATAREWKKNSFFRVLGEIANHFLRMSDLDASKNVDYYIANSEEVKSRIEKFYRKKATVIYPPVNLASSVQRLASSSKKKLNKNIPYQLDANSLEARRYYLAGGRLARPKHVDLIMEACGELGVQLKIFGRGFAGYEEELKAQSSKRKTQNEKIEFVGEVTDEEKFELMRGAKAFIFAGEDEDFGILPVEAMSCGLPVIAYRSGGVKETVIEGVTGVFFNQLTIESLKKAIQKFEETKIDPKNCIKQALKFSKERFKKELSEFIGQIFR